MEKDTAPDIIIPVHNAFHNFRLCFESLLTYTENSDYYSIIIINDASSDKELIQYFINRCLKCERVILLRNDEQRGFVFSVNRGMQSSKRDVILLNSDTIVTKNWVKKMYTCAYSREKIGTVTPFSNNATLVSFPIPWKNNDLPEGFSLQEISQFIEDVSLRIYPEIPSPVGFCLYIKREVLDIVGYFDPVYGLGYGEENDFGMRAYRQGYIHVLDDTTFIYHKGSATFQNCAQKEQIIKKNTELLYRRYPQLRKMMCVFFRDMPLNSLYKYMYCKFGAQNKDKPRVLFASACAGVSGNSGAWTHLEDLLRAVKKYISPFLIYREDDRLILLCYDTDQEPIRCVFTLKDTFDFRNFSHQNFEDTWRYVLKIFEIDIVHFQTPQDFPLSVFKITKDEKKMVFITVHDFFFHCPTLLLNRFDEDLRRFVFCNYEKREKICHECLKYKTGSKTCASPHYGFIQKRKEYIVNNVLSSIDVFFFPSRFIQRKILKLFPSIKEDTTAIIPHSVSVKKYFKKKEYRRGDVMHVAFVGLFTETKGSKIFTDIVRMVSRDQSFLFFIIGEIEDIASFNLIEKYKNVRCVGKYERKNLGDIVEEKGIHIALMLSICRETFNFVIHECFSFGLPVIVLNIGAQCDYIKETGAGWIVHEQSPEQEIISILKEIRNNPDILFEKSRKIPQEKTVEEVTEEYKKFYLGNQSYYREGLRAISDFALYESIRRSEVLQKKETRMEIFSYYSLVRRKIFFFLHRIGVYKEVKVAYTLCRNFFRIIFSTYKMK